MKEIVVLSGKGGAGKTSITAAFAALGAKDLVLADCDVDAADMHLLTAPEIQVEEDFYSGKVYEVKTDGCVHCFKCMKVCHFDAVSHIDGEFVIDPMECEGCGYCYQVCPTRTIEMHPRLAGKFYVSNTRFGNTLVHARLGIAADNSGKLVTKVREEAKKMALEQQKKYVLVDASPGIGCPVVASLTGAHFVVMVTEPTVSGLHDLSRVYELIRKLKLKSGCIINKADINPEMAGQIKQFLEENDVPLLAELPYDVRFTEAISQAKTIVEYDQGALREKLVKAWEEVRELTDK
ncbi:ATP-binding protein [Candidatus Sulfidibacterium hydrothermale]|uniref:ATP-binding protein n=1 Tax=Candidatus Sulfidibacterium hydrothermale TaxID=2875962 RepID=UPI001F0A4607|nr:ATP-binding protein [Candidatus Sulfidibacterium hydrothermale]UBM61913.1 ATP-binding protein [Candidatus Sulfidibacterium hydrothermale]